MVMQKRGLIFSKRDSTRLISLLSSMVPHGMIKKGTIRGKNVLLPESFAGVSEASFKRLRFLSLK